jgi:hypothetical protein
VGLSWAQLFSIQYVFRLTPYIPFVSSLGGTTAGKALGNRIVDEDDGLRCR